MQPKSQSDSALLTILRSRTLKEIYFLKDFAEHACDTSNDPDIDTGSIEIVFPATASEEVDKLNDEDRYIKNHENHSLRINSGWKSRMLGIIYSRILREIYSQRQLGMKAKDSQLHAEVISNTGISGTTLQMKHNYRCTIDKTSSSSNQASGDTSTSSKIDDQTFKFAMGLEIGSSSGKANLGRLRSNPIKERSPGPKSKPYKALNRPYDRQISEIDEIIANIQARMVQTENEETIENIRIYESPGKIQADIDMSSPNMHHQPQPPNNVSGVRANSDTSSFKNNRGSEGSRKIYSSWRSPKNVSFSPTTQFTAKPSTASPSSGGSKSFLASSLDPFAVTFSPSSSSSSSFPPSSSSDRTPSLYTPNPNDWPTLAESLLKTQSPGPSQSHLQSQSQSQSQLQSTSNLLPSLPTPNPNDRPTLAESHSKERSQSHSQSQSHSISNLLPSVFTPSPDEWPTLGESHSKAQSQTQAQAQSHPESSSQAQSPTTPPTKTLPTLLEQLNQFEQSLHHLNPQPQDLTTNENLYLEFLERISTQNISSDNDKLGLEYESIFHKPWVAYTQPAYSIPNSIAWKASKIPISQEMEDFVYHIDVRYPQSLLELSKEEFGLYCEVKSGLPWTGGWSGHDHDYDLGYDSAERESSLAGKEREAPADSIVERAKRYDEQFDVWIRDESQIQSLEEYTSSHPSQSHSHTGDPHH